MSSLMFLTHGMPRIASPTFFRKISAGHERPKLRCLYWNSPTCVENVLSALESGCNGIWWYPWFKSILLNTLQPFKSDTTSSMVGMMYRSLMIALFSEGMSTQILISFGLFGLGTTIGDTQGVGPSTRSMMSSFSSCLSFSSNCFLTWKGTRRWSWPER